MNTINKLLDKASEACSVNSDRQLAKKIGVSPSAISLWRSGRQIKDDHLMTVIKLAQADPALAVLVRTEGAESPAEKAGWSVVWDRLSPVTTVIGGLVLAVCMTPALARAKPVEIQHVKKDDARILYIMFRLLAWLSHRLRQSALPPLHRRQHA